MNDLLQTAAHEGTGSAARILTGSGLTGIRRYRPFLTVLIVAAIGFAAITSLYRGGRDPSAENIPLAFTPSPNPSAPPVAEQLFPDQGHSAVGSVHSYALALDDLAGLPPDISPGTRLRVWVAWDPPVTQRPKMQRLLDQVMLERIVAPVTALGPFSVVLAVAERQLPRLMYGDRYGALSVSVLP